MAFPSLRLMPILGASFLLAFGPSLLPFSAFASAPPPPIRAGAAYEDSVRVLLLWNPAQGQSYCPASTVPVGEKTRDFVRESLGPLKQVVVRSAAEASWQTVEEAFGGKLPHVVVHVNAGWHQASGQTLYEVLARAAEKRIGVVSVGDDAAHFADRVFGFFQVENRPLPMDNAVQFDKSGDRLWIDLSPPDSLGNPGVTRHVRDSLGRKTLAFKPFSKTGGETRCEEDADRYRVMPGYRDRLTFLGLQKAFDSRSRDTVGKEGDLQVIAAFQDGYRRGVALSYQPQALVDAEASRQILYDAVRYASFAHLEPARLSPPEASPPGGAFGLRQTVLLSSREGAEIRYTLDGSDPARSPTARTYQGPLKVTVTSRLRAMARMEGRKDSDPASFDFVKAPGPDEIAFGDQFGNPLSLGFLTEKDPAASVRLRTGQDLDSVLLGVRALSSGDRETLEIGAPVLLGPRLEFSGRVALSIDPFPGPSTDTAPSAAPSPQRNDRAGDGLLSARPWDTLLAEWSAPQPRDSALLPVRDTVLLRPAPVQALVLFTASPGGPESPGYAGDEDRVHGLVLDQAPKPGAAYSLRLEAGDREGLDTEEVALEIDARGRLFFSLPLQRSDSSLPGDGTVQARPGMTFRASYRDPVDGDSALGLLGFGRITDLPGLLSFAAADGSPFGGATWPAGNPRGDSLHLIFRDDWIKSKQVALRLVSRPLGMETGRRSSDTEYVALQNPRREGPRGTWAAAIPLSEGHPVPGDGRIQVDILSRVVVEGYGHGPEDLPRPTDSVFDPEAQGRPRLTDEIRVARPDRSARVEVRDAEAPEKPLGRETRLLLLSVFDQDLSPRVDTVRVRVQCGASGDYLPHLPLVEAEPGHYRSRSLRKAEGASSPQDSILTCRESDVLTLSYADPVYGGEAEESYAWIYRKGWRMAVTSDSAGSHPLARAEEEKDSLFFLQVEGPSPSLNERDTVWVEATTPEGEAERFAAVETGAFTERFRAEIPFSFGPSSPLRGNGRLEGRWGGREGPGSGSESPGGETPAFFRAPGADLLLPLLPAFRPAKRAYIRDGNNNGRADSLFIVFAAPLPFLPDSISSIYWNGAPAPGRKDGTEARRAGRERIAFGAEHDSSVVVVSFADREFPPALTEAVAAFPPRLTLPGGRLFGGQQVLIEDSLGPVPVLAVKQPAARPLSALGPEPETLTVTVSEPLRVTQGLRLLRFGPCLDYGGSRDLRSAGLPLPQDPAGKVWKVVVDPGAPSPQGDHCVYLNAEGEVTDAFGNRPSRYGVPLRLKRVPRRIESVEPFPAVAGPGEEPFYRFAQEGREYRFWNPPVGFSADFSPSGLYRPRPSAPGSGCPHGQTQEPGREAFPPCLSTLKVVSTTAYQARFTVHDHLGNFIRAGVQDFGLCGEKTDPTRLEGPGLASHLVWDGRDEKGRPVGQGVYIWKVRFSFPDSPDEEVHVVRSGFFGQCRGR